MKYQDLHFVIPTGRRKEINNKILALIEHGDMQGVTGEHIFNTYTGIGGLHGLKFNEHDSFHSYTQAKQEIENGQFFTPIELSRQLAELISIRSNETIADLTCGAGVFANFFPEHQFYGCDIDAAAIKVANFLFPSAHMEKCDLRYWQPDVKFNYIIGNPPFNLKWKIGGTQYKSQTFFFKRAAELLRPGGIIMAIVPASFCADEFNNKSEIELLNDDYNFLFQIKLSADTFKAIGVSSFDTKVVAMQRKSEHLSDYPFQHDTFYNWQEANDLVYMAASNSHSLAAKLNAENASNNSPFDYKVKKYLYEIKTHKILLPHLPKAAGYVEKFRTQKCPDNMKWEEWQSVRLTEDKVLSFLHRIVKKQNAKQEDRIELVKYNYGFKMKAYSNKSKALMYKLHKKRVWSFNDAVLFPADEQIPQLPKGYKKLLERKRAAYKNQDQKFEDVVPGDHIRKYTEAFSFINKEEAICRFNDMQRRDLGKILTKNYSCLNWQQGSGKTAAAYSWAEYQNTKVTFVISTGMSVNMTWAKFLDFNKVAYTNVQSMKDIADMGNNPYILISHDFMTKYQKLIQKFIKHQAYKVSVIVDESDEFTNHRAKRTRASINSFKKAKKKLLTTGTTTRNNIGELYSQMEFLYNNSINFLCTCPTIFVQDKETKEIEEETNTRINQPFPAYYGNTLFKQCFNPARTTVFGIQQFDQRIYNEEHLTHLIGKTIITRKFREIAGDKYNVHNIPCFQNSHERHVYHVIIREFYNIVNYYFTSTGNSRKDAGLKMVRQLQLLINACSKPQYFKEYNSSEDPNKAKAIFQRLTEFNDEIVAIGCITIEAAEWYRDNIQKHYPDRPVFFIKGDINFRKRGDIIDKFQASGNGILISTQQSLKSSVNIPLCNKVFIESLQWNIPKIEQYYFRFIRYDSPEKTDVYFFNYHDTIETNLLALLMAKEKLNDFIKVKELKTDSQVFEEYGIDLGILQSLITKEKDEEGNVSVRWGKELVN